MICLGLLLPCICSMAEVHHALPRCVTPLVTQRAKTAKTEDPT